MTKSEYMELMGLAEMDEQDFRWVNELYTALPCTHKDEFCRCMKVSEAICRTFPSDESQKDLDPMYPVKALANSYRIACCTMETHGIKFRLPQLHTMREAEDAEKAMRARMDRVVAMMAVLNEALEK